MRHWLAGIDAYSVLAGDGTWLGLTEEEVHLGPRGERDAPRPFTAPGLVAGCDPGDLRRGHPRAGDRPGIRLERGQQPAVGGAGPGVRLDDRRRAARPLRRDDAPRAADR